jgi:hypothetical protein
MSSSRTAVPFAHAAHSGLTRRAGGAPNSAAPPGRGVVDDAVHDHLRNVALDGDAVGCNGCDFPGELLIPRQAFL